MESTQRVRIWPLHQNFGTGARIIVGWRYETVGLRTVPEGCPKATVLPPECTRRHAVCFSRRLWISPLQILWSDKAAKLRSQNSRNKKPLAASESAV